MYLETIHRSTFPGVSILNQIQHAIGQIQRPLFCVIRNLDQSISVVDFPFDVSDLRGEFVGLTCTFEQARRLVPQPEYPEDNLRQEHFHKRFGWHHIAMSDGSMLRQVPSFGFDDDPISDRRQSDMELFGESYTIFLVCPPDPEIIASTQIDQAQQLIASDPPPLAPIVVGESPRPGTVLATVRYHQRLPVALRLA